MRNHWGGKGRLLATALFSVTLSASAADFSIYDQDAGTDAGLNSDTPTEAVGGNYGDTLGEQRRIALRRAVRIVLSRVASSVPVRIRAGFVDDGSQGLDCATDSATLGLGGPMNYSVNFPGAPKADVVYPLALAEAIVGRRFARADGTGGRIEDLGVIFNGQLDEGRASCLGGTRWYYGLDGKAPDGRLDFVATAVHEMIHGLGFQSLVALQPYRDDDGELTTVGQFPEFINGQRYPDIYSSFIQDLSMTGQPLWADLSADERADSLDDGPAVVWSTANTANAAGGYLTAGLNQGRPELYAPADISVSSSISHWSTRLSPAQIMAPFESPDTSVLSGIGLASCVFEDLGWTLAGNTRCPDVDSDTIMSDAQGAFVDANGDIVATTNRADDDSVAASDNDDDSSGDGGGGGCTLAPGSAFDPIWALMLGLAGGVLIWRRRGRGMV